MSDGLTDSAVAILETSPNWSESGSFRRRCSRGWLMLAAAASRPAVSLLLPSSALMVGAGSFSPVLMPSTLATDASHVKTETSKTCADVSHLPTHVWNHSLARGTLAGMSDDAGRDVAIAQHFMRALDAALKIKGLTRGQAEDAAGLPRGTLSLWMLGKRVPSALRFAEVAAKLGLDPGAILNEGFALARRAGLLDDVEALPLAEQPVEHG